MPRRAVESRTYDVCIVGAGPAGSTCGFYLAQQGLSVLLLEKEQFPRDKLCGDAVCSPAHPHLRKMGVLQAVEAEGRGNWARVGGMVGPNGSGYIGNPTNDTYEPLVIAIRRIVLDEKMARAAAAAGATLVEQYAVGSAELSASEGLWTVHHRDRRREPFRARVLVAADGALSRLARSLGIVHTRPDAICSRAYLDAKAANFDADGVVYYPPEMLPGYCALFREAEGLINFCCYIIPGGKSGISDLKRVHEGLVRDYDPIRNAVGAASIERMRGGPLRLGGIPRSFADRLLILGDAAGHIDPLTGEGIHYAIQGAAMGAEVLAEAFRANDLSATYLQRYHQRWQRAFGRDFRWSARMARICARHPRLLDATVALIRRRGVNYLRDWGEAMTGARPKSTFLRPHLAFPLLREVALQWLG